MREDDPTRTQPTVDEAVATSAEDSSWAPAPDAPPEEAELRRGRRFERRYVLGEILAEGGTSTIHRARDVLLERTIAVKLLNGMTAQPLLSARFLAEARICARLSHPGILTVFDWGIRTDGRPYIAMPEIQGETLRSHLRRLQRSGAELLAPAVLRRLIGIVLSVCEAMACAHSQGILHRDIKPENVMIGSFGEVYVMDWGLGMIRDAPFPDLSAEAQGGALDAAADDELLVDTGGIGWQSHTTDGLVRGTMPYIPPEQAHGQNRSLDARADVFMLGAILYEILTGTPPWGWGSNRLALSRARAAQPLQLPETARIPERIREICLRAVAIAPEDRYPDADQLARDLKGWLDRQDDVERASLLLQRAAAAAKEADQNEQSAATLEGQAAQSLSAIPADAPEEERHPAWDQLDEAQGLRRRAQILRAERVQYLHSALSFDPENLDAHARLAAHYQQLHAEAEARQDALAAEQLLVQLRQHNRGQLDDYLRPEGRLTLRTDPPGAQVRIGVYQERHRRLVLVPLRDGLTTPIEHLTLPIGSYLAEIQAPGRHTVRLPFTIQRGQHTHGAFSPEQPPHTCWLPLADTAPEGMVYVPAGPAWSGGDPLAHGAPLPLRRVWVDGLWIDQHPVTNTRFLAFLNDLVAQGREAEAEACCPRGKATLHSAPGIPAYGRDADGRFILVTDTEGHTWQPGWPVIMVDMDAIQAFVAWESQRRRLPLRLPYELEWEKAARGADRRTFVWGTDRFEPSWCRCRLSRVRTPAVVGTHPVDVSVYGMMDVAGNISERCLDPFFLGGPYIDPDTGRWTPPPDQGLRQHSLRGGSWGSNTTQNRLCMRGGLEDHQRPVLTGFRLVCPL